MNINLESLPIWAHGVLVVVTIIVIAKGAAWMVEAAARLAQKLGISELIIGLTVVAFGTSAPEFAVTILSALRGQGDISVGNIVGSNIFNLGFILGGCAIARAIPTSKTLVYRDGTVLLIGTIFVGLFIGHDLSLDRIDGIILFTSLLAYLFILFRKRGEGAEVDDEVQELLSGEAHSLAADIAGLFGGLIAIVAGSHFLVISASAIARYAGLSEWVIGVTIVAAGTSAPEFATTFTGIIKKKYALSAGNVIGSDIFNVFGVLGLAGIIESIQVEAAARSSLIGLSAMVFLVLLFMRTGWKISRIQGGILVLVAVSRWVIDFASRAPG